MECRQVRGAILEQEVESIVEHDRISFLRHVRTCDDCRQELSREDRDRAVLAIITLIE